MFAEKGEGDAYSYKVSPISHTPLTTSINTTPIFPSCNYKGGSDREEKKNKGGKGKYATIKKKRASGDDK